MNLSKIPTGAWLLAVVLVAAIAGVTISVTDDGHGGRTVVVTKTHTVEAPPQVVVPDANTQLSPAEAKEDAKPTKAGDLDLHEDAKDETPPGVSAEELKEGREATDALADKTLVAPELPAGAQNYKCTYHPVVNHSSLTHKIIGVAMHFTVSDPGSLPGIFNLFNTRSFGASSTYGYELFSNVCWQFVSLGQKAWAQLSANSYYWSIELVSRDRSRASWLATPAFKTGKLAALVADLLKRAGAPPRLVDPKGCVFEAGLTDHSRLECGNTHWDVGENFPWDVFMAQVRAHYNGADYKPACGKNCKRVKELRGKHERTHRRIRKNKCAHGNRDHKGRPKVGGYCGRLRGRNAAVHRAVADYNRRHPKHRMSLKGTYK